MANQQHWRFGFPRLTPVNELRVAVVAHEHRGIKKSDSAIQDFILTPILPVSFLFKIKFSSFRQFRRVSKVKLAFPLPPLIKSPLTVSEFL